MKIKIRINKRKIKYLFIIILALIGSLMFHVEKDENLDFLRYQDILYSLRVSDMSLLDYLIYSNNTTRWTNAMLPYAFGFNTLLFIVAKYFKNDYVLVWISVLIDYTIIAYIAYDWRKEAGYKGKEVVMIVLACFSLLPYIQVNSGLRTATSACIMALAIYRYLYKKVNMIVFFALSLLSVLFHPFSLFAIPIAIVIKMSKSKKVFFITLLGCLFISNIAQIFENSGISFLKAMAIKYKTYTWEGQFRAYRFCLYGVLLTAIICIVYYLLVYRKNKYEMCKYDSSDRESIYLFIVSYCGLVLGQIGSYELVVRNGYLLGALSPILVTLFFESDSHIKETQLIRLSVVALFLYMSAKYIHYYYTFFI